MNESSYLFHYVQPIRTKNSFPSFFLFFSRFTVAMSNSKSMQIWPRAKKSENFPMYRNLHWSHRWRGWSHRWRRLASPIFFSLLCQFFTENKAFCIKTKLEVLAFQNTRQNVSFPTETICRILYGTRSRALR